MAKDLRLRLKKEDLCKLYLEEKRSLEDIARLYGVSRVAVWQYCKAGGLKTRNKSEARIEAQKKGKVPQSYLDINDSFFSNWSSEMAYVLGLIITDGCLSRSGTVSLCINDKDLLEKVRNLIGAAHAVKYYGYQKGLYSFSFSRQKICADLNRLGIYSNKSLNVRFPEVPDAFLLNFIRGIFDGDGSVFFEKRSPKLPLRASFVSGSKSFIEALESKLRGLGMPKRNIYQQKTKNAISYMIRYAHEDSVRLFNLIYDHEAMEKGLYLARKYSKFLTGMSQGG